VRAEFGRGNELREVLQVHHAKDVVGDILERRLGCIVMDFTLEGLERVSTNNLNSMFD
jgi:hypothetical protein